MYCQKCGQKLLEGDKFCLNCGEKVIDRMISNNDNKQMVTDKEKNFKDKVLNFWIELDIFSKITAISIVVGLMLCILAFLIGKVLAGFIAVVEITLFIVAWLIKKQIIKLQLKWLPVLLIGIAYVLTIPYFLSYSISNSKSYDYSYDKYSSEIPTTEAIKKLEWPEHPLAKLVPIPKSEFGYIEWEYDDNICIVVENTTEQDYKDYIKKCEEAGFIDVTSKGDNFYYSKNSEGYRISLHYDNNANSMTLNIEEPLLLVNIEIECIENLLFSRYDIIIDIDFDEIGTLEHGKSETYQVELEKGTHTLKLKNAEDNEVNKEVDFEVTEDTKVLNFKISCKNNEIIIDETKPIKLPVSSDEVINKTYEELKTLFEEAGFYTIEKKELNDLSTNQKDKENTVNKVIIGELSEFTKEDSFMPDTKIVIECHSLAKIAPPFNTSSAKGMNYNDVVEAFKKAGFTNVITKEVTISHEWKEDNNTVKEISINDEKKFDTKDKFNPDSEVVVSYYVVEEVIHEDTDLTIGRAEIAFENYGESLYPYGFKCHWFLNLINAEQTSDGKWIFKVGVTITTIYGTEYDAIAEGKVSGSDANPIVEDFFVY